MKEKFSNFEHRGWTLEVKHFTKEGFTPQGPTPLMLADRRCFEIEISQENHVQNVINLNEILNRLLDKLIQVKSREGPPL
jgi:hypothetical protein